MRMDFQFLRSRTTLRTVSVERFQKLPVAKLVNTEASTDPVDILNTEL